MLLNKVKAAVKVAEEVLPLIICAGYVAVQIGSILAVSFTSRIFTQARSV